MSRPLACDGLDGRVVDAWMPRPYNAMFLEMLRKGDRYVLYVSTAVEPQKEARTRVSKTYEHEKRPQSVGSPSSEGPGAFDGLDTGAARPSAPLVFLKQDVSPQLHGAFQPNSERKSRADGSGATLVMS